jgi:G3E family GTPase
MTSPVAGRYRLQQVVTAVDSQLGLSTINQHPESVKQAAVADDIILTKIDLGADVGPLLARLKSLNPGAQVHRSSSTKLLQPNELRVAYIFDPKTKSDEILEWLNTEAYSHADHAPTGAPHDHHHHDVNRHSADISSFCLQFSTSLHWEHVANWLDALVVCHGDNLLRVKGILNVVGREKPIVVQAVQRLFHPPFELARWPSDDRTSRIVFITRSLSREYVAEVFDTIRQRAIPDDANTSGTVP